jgi:glycogen operon protein
VKNFLTATLLSIGLPMILMGDEVRRTQRGNNNAYCLDDESNWFDWTLLARHADVHRFVTLLNARRLLRDVEHERQRMSLTEMIRQATKAWHGVKLNQPDWRDNSHSIAFGVEMRREGLMVHIILNAYWEPLGFELPRLPGGDTWKRWIDTALDSPHDIVPWETATPVGATTYRAAARSVVGRVATAASADTRPA